MISKRIKQLRSTLKLTQVDFACKIGMESRAVYKWEHDLVKIKESSLRLIETVFDVNPEWLRCGKGNMFLPAAKEDSVSELDDIFAWAKSLTKDQRIWLKIEMCRHFPEFRQWLGTE